MMQRRRCRLQPCPLPVVRTERARALALGVTLALIQGMPIVLADDTDVYSASASSAGSVASGDPTMMIMLDSSASMSQKDSFQTSRIERARVELQDFIRSSSDLRLGLSTFNGRDRGGAITLPALKLDAPRCLDADCEVVKIRHPIQRSGDDAVEYLSSGTADEADGRVLETGRVQLGQRLDTGIIAREFTRADEDTVVQFGTAAPQTSNHLGLYDPGPGGEPAVGVHFPNVDVPAGVTITRARLSFIWGGFRDLDAEAGEGIGDVFSRIRADSRTDSPAFGSAPGTRLNDRPTDGFVPWHFEMPQSWYVDPPPPDPDAHIEVVRDPPPTKVRIYSPDVSALLNPIIDPGRAHTLSFLLSPEPGAATGRENRLNLWGHSTHANVNIQLTINYERVVPDRVDYDNAFRFDSLPVPPGASIRSAHIEFGVDIGGGTNGQELELEIRRETGADAPPIGFLAEQISSRPTHADVVYWPVPRWPYLDSVPRLTPDLSGLLQASIDDPEWCAGNAVLFRITPSVGGNSSRDGISFDRDRSRPPTLVVEYETGGVDSSTACRLGYGANVVALAATAAAVIEDGVATPAPSRMTTDEVIAMRFDTTGLGGIEVGDAALTLHSFNNRTSDYRARFGVARAPAGAALTADSPFIADALASADAARRLRVVAGNERDDFANLEAQINSAISSADWSDTDSLIVTLQRTRGAVLSFHAPDAPLAPVLTILPRLRGEHALALPHRTHREEMLTELSTVSVSGFTPVMDAFYETSLYLLGQPVDHGRRRGEGDTQWNRGHRLSHPLSYTGGNVERPDGCSADAPGSNACVGETIAGSPVYDEPESGECSASRIVLVTDGIPSESAAPSDDGIRALTGIEACATAPTGENCAVELARWLNAGAGGRGKISVDTVGFTGGFDTSFLERVAAAGGGSFHQTSEAGELSRAIGTLVTAATVESASFIAPVVPLSAFNRFTHADQLYFSLFKPSPGLVGWPGNLKRYGFGALPGDQGVGLIDADGEPAFDSASGAFAAGARSFWSATPDGASVLAGGAASLLGSERRILTRASGAATTLTTPRATIDFDVELSTSQVSGAMLGVEESRRDAAIEWLRGADVLDADGDGDSSEARAAIGASTHTTPRLIRYAVEDSAVPRSVVFAGTQEGLLQAINAGTGAELWGYLAPELYQRVGPLFNNERGRIGYGLDGSIGAWITDNNRDGIIDATQQDRVVLLTGLRRGGRHYMALDVTDPDSPATLYTIGPDSNDDDYADIGQSWSAPAAITVRWPTDDGVVLRTLFAFGGGYDTANDSDALRSARASDTGSAIYLVEPATGELVDKIDPVGMNWSIPSDLAAVDIDLDGITDHLIVGDVGGNVWRVDRAEQVDGEWPARAIASLAGADQAAADRRFFHPPDVLFATLTGSRTRLIAAIGSGRRDAPLEQGAGNRLFAFFADAASGTIGENALGDAAEQPHTAEQSEGWYLDLVSSGEKILGTPRTVDGRLLVTSYKPPSGGRSGGCGQAIGGGKLYVLDVNSGTSVTGDANGDGEPEVLTTELDAPGIPPGVALMLSENGPDKPVVLVGGQVLDVTAAVPSVRQTSWSEH